MKTMSMRSARFALALVVASLACGGGGGGGGGSAGSPADWVCDKMVSCGMPSAYRSECMLQAKAMEMYVVDPEAAAACIESKGLTCSDLTALETGDPDHPPAWLTTCLAYDTASFQCSADETTLHICNTSHECKDVSCSNACTTVGYRFVGCEMSSKGYQQCACSP